MNAKGLRCCCGLCLWSHVAKPTCTFKSSLPHSRLCTMCVLAQLTDNILATAIS